jgi:hypothetical protein
MQAAQSQQLSQTPSNPWASASVEPPPQASNSRVPVPEPEPEQEERELTPEEIEAMKAAERKRRDEETVSKRC